MEPLAVSDECFKACIDSMPDYQITHKVFKGPTPDIGDLETVISYKPDSTENRIHSFWKPTEEELKHLVAGGAVELMVWSDHLHPVSIVAWGGSIKDDNV